MTLKFLSIDDLIARDEALVGAWHTTEPMSAICVRLGMRREAVYNAYRRLAGEGRIPDIAREHVPKDRRDVGEESRPITVGADPLLAKLIEVHGSWRVE